MSRSSGKAKDSLEGKTESVDPAMSEEEDEDIEAASREETPDLYRNSALGMYAFNCIPLSFYSHHSRYGGVSISALLRIAC
jgi:hypothetical protein